MCPSNGNLKNSYLPSLQVKQESEKWKQLLQNPYESLTIPSFHSTFTKLALAGSGSLKVIVTMPQCHTNVLITPPYWYAETHIRNKFSLQRHDSCEGGFTFSTTEKWWKKTMKRFQMANKCRNKTDKITHIQVLEQRERQVLYAAGWQRHGKYRSWKRKSS